MNKHESIENLHVYSSLYACKVSWRGEIILQNFKEVCMTTNQLALWELRETQRANREKEKLTHADIAEKERAARQREAIQWFSERSAAERREYQNTMDFLNTLFGGVETAANVTSKNVLPLLI